MLAEIGAMAANARLFTIYCHTHVASQKRYVGQTVKSMERRWSEHVNETRGRLVFLFQRAIRAHGPDAFSHEVLEVVSTHDAANDAEAWWIAHFGSDDRTLGYNLLAGGRAHGLSEETRRKMSESQKKRMASLTPEQRKLTPESRRKISAAATAQMAALDPEQRRQSARNAVEAKWAAMTPEERSEHGRKVAAAMTQEQRDDRNRRCLTGVAALSHEQRSASSRKGHAGLSPEFIARRASAGAKAQAAAMTPEERKERSRKALAARWPKKL